MEFEELQRNAVQNSSSAQQQEDWTRLEKITQLSLQSIVSFFLLVSAGATMYFLISLFLHHFDMNSLLMMITCSLIIILALLSLFWSLQEPSEMKKSSELWWDTSDHGLSRFIFIFSSTLLSLLLTSCLGMYLFQDSTKNYFTARGSKTELQSYKQQLMFIEILGIPNFLGTAFIAFTSFAFSNNTNSVRIALYCQGIVAAMASGCLIYCAGSSLTLKDLGIIPSGADFVAIEFIVEICAVILFVIFLIKIANISQSKNGFIAVGTLLALISFVLISQSGKVFRNRNELVEKMTQNCQLTLSGSHENKVKSEGCLVKYLESASQGIVPSCPRKQQSLMWEQDLGKVETAKLNKVACLNMNCCGAAVNLYVKWFNFIVFFAVLLMLNCFLLIMYSYYLSNKYAGDQQLNRNLEMLYFFMFIIIIVLLSFGYTKYLQDLKNDNPDDIRAFSTKEKEYNDYDGDHYKFRTRTYIHEAGISLTRGNNEFQEPNYSQWNSYQFKDISPLATCLEASRTFEGGKAPDIDQNKCVSEKCRSEGLRVGIMINGGKFFFDTPFGSKNIRFFSMEAQEIFFPEQKASDFLAFEGEPVVVKKFISDNLLLCISDPANFSSLMIVGQFDISQLDSGGANLETLNSDLENFQRKKFDALNENIYHPFNDFERSDSHSEKLEITHDDKLRKLTVIDSEQKTYQQNKKVKKEKTEAHHLQDNPEQKWKEAAVSFAAVKFEMHDASTGELINIKDLGDKVQIRIYKNQIKCRLYDDLFPIQILKGSISEAYNMELGTYTFFVDIPGYQQYCQSITLNIKSEIQTAKAYLSPRLEKHQMRAVLEWKEHDSQQKTPLRLFAEFDLSATFSCISGYLNQLCPGVKYETGDDGYSSVLLEKFGEYKYLFFVKEVNTEKQIQKKLNDEKAGQKYRNTAFFQSQATITVYVGEIQYAPITLDVPAISGTQEKTIQSQNSIAWIGFCVDGSLGNQVVPGRDFWSSLSNYQDSPKKIDTMLFPPSVICEEIISKQ